jgi:hypothetical protein
MAKEKKEKEKFITYVIHDENGGEIKIRAHYFLIEEDVAKFFYENDVLVAVFRKWTMIRDIETEVKEVQSKEDSSVYSPPVPPKKWQ